MEDAEIDRLLEAGIVKAPGGAARGVSSESGRG
jgi:hypothetical protein